MAIYRKINTTFWSDPFICDLSPERKLFYLYLLTNERTKQCGIYDISKRQISFDLGISVDMVSKTIKFFSDKGKIMFSDDTNEIAIKNWYRFNGSTSPKVVSCVESELKLVKNRVLIQYIYSIDTLSQETQAQTQEEEETQAQAPTKKEEEFKRFNFIKSLSDFGFDEDLIKDWLIIRKNKKASNTKTAFESLESEFLKCENELNIDRNTALKYAVESSWSGFKCQWIKNEQLKNLNNGKQQTGRISNEQRLDDIFNGGKYDHLI